MYLGGESQNFSSHLRADSLGQGNSGNISIHADNVLLEDGAALHTSSEGSGQSGDIEIVLSGDFIARGASALDGLATKLSTQNLSTEINAPTGAAGDIYIQAQSVVLQDGAHLAAGSESSLGASQDAGSVRLEIKGALLLSGVNPYGENSGGFASKIDVRSLGPASGQAGLVQINAASIDIRDGARIETGSGDGNRIGGGEIQIHASEYINIDGDASDIELQTPLSSQQSYLASVNSDKTITTNPPAASMPTPTARLPTAAIVATSCSARRICASAKAHKFPRLISAAAMPDKLPYKSVP